MAKPVEMLKHGARARLVVHEDVADGIEFDFAPNDDRGDSPALEIGEKIDVHRKPIGDDDQPLDAAIEEHLEVTLEAMRLVVRVGQHGQVRRLIERILDAAENGRTERVGQIEDHDADGVGAAAAQVTSERSEEHTSELQSPCNLVCRLLLEKKKKKRQSNS